MKKLKELGEMLIAIPIIILIGLALIIMLPFDYLKYKRSAYYKKEHKKYRPFAASGVHFDLYNEMLKHGLPLEYISDPEDDDLACGWFVLGKTLIIVNVFSFEYDEENGTWNYCCEDEESETSEERVIISLDEYIDETVSEANERAGRSVCTDAVVLIEADSVDNAEAAKAEPRFLVYSDPDPDNGMAEVLKRFCGVEDAKRKERTAKTEKRHRKESATRKELKGFAKIFANLILVVATCCVCFAGIFLLDCVIELLLLPENYLFYEHTPVCGSLLSALIIIPSLLLAYLILYVIGKKLGTTAKDHLGIVRFLRFLGKWLIPIGAVWIIATYACITSMTYVTSDTIVVTSPIDLKGQEYSYSQVEKIECGFGDKKHSMYEYRKRGSFYYKITLDGEDRVFHMPTVNPDVERYDDTYLELEEFDLALTKLDIPKTSSPQGHEHCNFDRIYVDRFLRIIGSEH